MRPDETTEELVAYVLGALGPQDSSRVEARLDASAEMRRLLDKVRGIVAALSHDESVEPAAELVDRVVALFRESRAAPRPSALAGLRRAVAALVFDSRLQPALAGFRGTAGARHLSWTSELGGVDLELSPPRPGTDPGWRILGQLAGNDRRGGAEVSLVRRATGGEVAAGRCDERGTFRLLAGPGDYDVLIGLGSGTLVLENLRVG